MDECDVDKGAVVLPVVAEYSPGNNQECAQWGREHPDRLAVLADVPMHQQDAAERVLRAGEEFGAVGTSYYPPKLDERMQWMLEEACDALWQAVQRHWPSLQSANRAGQLRSLAGVGPEVSRDPLCRQSSSPWPLVSLPSLAAPMPKTRRTGDCCRQRPIPICQSKRRGSTRRQRLLGIAAVPKRWDFSASCSRVWAPTACCGGRTGRRSAAISRTGRVWK